MRIGGGHTDNRQTETSLSDALDGENEGRQHDAGQVPGGPGDAAGVNKNMAISFDDTFLCSYLNFVFANRTGFSKTLKIQNTLPSGFSQISKKKKRRNGEPLFFVHLFVHLFRTSCENFRPRILNVRSPGHVK